MVVTQNLSSLNINHSKIGTTRTLQFGSISLLFVPVSKKFLN